MRQNIKSANRAAAAAVVVMLVFRFALGEQNLELPEVLQAIVEYCSPTAGPAQQQASEVRTTGNTVLIIRVTPSEDH